MSPSTYKLLTDALVLFHFTFVAFVVLGGLLALRWRWLGWFHIPAVLWVIWIETTGNICPLTPMENDLRRQAGMTTYEGGFVDHYIMPILYPEALTRDLQMTIAFVLVAANLISYGVIAFLTIRRRWRTRLAAAGPSGDVSSVQTEPRQPENVEADADTDADADAAASSDKTASSPALPPVR